MKSLPLLLGLLAIVGAAISATLYRQLTRNHATHAAELARAESRLQTADAHAAKLSAETASLQAQVAELDASLGEAKTKLTVTEARNVQLTRELAVATQAAQQPASQTAALQQEIVSLQRDLASARAAAISPELVAGFQATIADLEGQLAQARSAPASAVAVSPTAQSDAILTTHRGRHASVASVGPSSAFVVLNYGAAHGALPEQQLLIRRGTDELARVLISDVRDQYSIAQVRPDTLRGALHKGDLAVLTE